MGEIISLPARRAQSERRAHAAPLADTARILLFTGIRYERPVEPQTRPDPKKPRGRRRA